MLSGTGKTVTVKAAGAAKFRNAGQVCISPTRFLVQESIRNDFANALAKHAQGLKVGDGLEPGVDIGPLIDQAGIDKATEHVQDALAKGARPLMRDFLGRFPELDAAFPINDPGALGVISAIESAGLRVRSVRVWETDTCQATYRP